MIALANQVERIRSLFDEAQQCASTTGVLILACIVYWRAREISRLAAAPDFLFGVRHEHAFIWS